MGNNTRRIEKLIIKYVNHSRRKRNLPSLKTSRGLCYLARRHSKRMARAGRIWHGSNVHRAGQYVSTGFFESLFGFFLGLSSQGAGENCAMMPRGMVRGIGNVRSDRDLARAFHRTWMQSHGHKRNILDSRFTRIGVGVARRGNKFYSTQVFYG
jgi:uncharacterized protein YkwD